MYVYEKRLQCPVNIKIRNPKTAQFILSQYGGAYINNVYKILLLIGRN